MKGLLANRLPKRMSQSLSAWFGKAGEGYTVIEVMITLAVTGMLFVSVAVMMSGRQANAEFTQSVRTYETIIQNLVSETANGYYRTEFPCSSGAADYSYNFDAGGSAGANVGCVFIGKVLVPHNNDKNTHVLTMVGRQYAPGSSTELATTIAESQPVVVPDTKNIDQLLTHKYQMRVTRMVDPGGNNYQAIAYFIPTSGGVANAATAGNNSGVLLYGIAGTVSDGAASLADTRSKIQDFNPAEVLPLSDGLTICMEGANGFKAELRLGANNSQTGILSTINKDFSGDCY